jgi:hypothetical protein
VCSVVVKGVQEKETSSFLVLVCLLGAKITEIKLVYDYLVRDLFTRGDICIQLYFHPGGVRVQGLWFIYTPPA